jgi:type IX secretion system PorP/SprF family membrane protein
MRTITLFTSSLLCLLSFNTSAQNIQHTLVDATPLILNPAFAGNTPGKLRVIANHRFESNNSFSPYSNTNISVDAPLLTLKNGDYIGGGLYTNLHNMRDEYYEKKNQSFNASMSAHKLIRIGKSKGQKNLLEIALGVTGGVASQFHDASIDYFTYNGHNTLQPMIPVYYITAGSSYYNIDIGTSVSHSVGNMFNYTVAYSINNINDQSDALKESQAQSEGLNRRHLITLGGNIYLNNRWQLRPCFIHIKQSTTTNYIAGNEFMYHLKKSQKQTSLFAGLWYRSGDMHSVTAGINRTCWRAAIAVDYGISNPKRIYYNNAVELSLTYAMQPTKNRRKQMVCNRF